MIKYSLKAKFFKRLHYSSASSFTWINIYCKWKGTLFYIELIENLDVQFMNVH